MKRRGWRWWISRRTLWVLFALFHGRRYGRLVLERISGIPIVVLPGVFHPALFVSTPLLLDVLDRYPLKQDSPVLDMGTGTGVCAILLAEKGARVTVVDISPLAMRCAHVNVALNFMEDRVRMLKGDLFTPIGNERYDLVIFNPPYYEGKPGDWPDHAWRGERVLERFAEGLLSHLTEDGRALLSLSTEMDLAAVRGKLTKNGFEVHERRRRRLLGETIFVCECIPSRAFARSRDEATSEAGSR